jgi:hypothetical protein
MKLTEKQDSLIKNFATILIYGNSQLSKAEMHPTKIRPKKYILFCAMAAVQSYSEAILKLMRPDNVYDKASEVLLRSLVETYINLNYIFAPNNNKNAVIFIIESEKDKIDFARKHQKLWEKYPKWKLEFGTIKKSSDWNQFILDREEIIQQVAKKYKKAIPPLPGLIDRGIFFDKNYVKKAKLSHKQAVKKLEGKSLEKYYILYYKHFSQLAHLTMPGLEQFMKVDEDGRTWIDIDGDQLTIDRIVPVCFVIYLTILTHFLKQFKLYDKSAFKQYRVILRSLGKKPQNDK